MKGINRIKQQLMPVRPILFKRGKSKQIRNTYLPTTVKIRQHIET